MWQRLQLTAGISAVLDGGLFFLTTGVADSFVGGVQRAAAGAVRCLTAAAVAREPFVESATAAAATPPAAPRPVVALAAAMVVRFPLLVFALDAFAFALGVFALELVLVSLLFMTACALGC